MGQHSPSKICVFYRQILQTSRLDRRASRLSKTRRKSQRRSSAEAEAAVQANIVAAGYGRQS
jgi:hypothetical protein